MRRPGVARQARWEISLKNRTYANLLLIAACAAVPGIARAQQDAAPPPAALSPVPESDVPQLRDALLNPSTRQDQREMAALRLLARPGEEARAALRDALMEVRQSNVQLAAARALADNPTPDPSLINALFALIDPASRKDIIDAAAGALGAYKDNADVLTRLLSLARDGSDLTIRLAAIKSVGTFVEKRVGQAMVELIDPTAQPPAINQAAREALAYMTGMRADLTSNEQWQAWWNANREKPDAQFKADLVQSRAGRYDATVQQLSDLQDEIVRMLQEQYQRSPQADRADALLRSLRSNQPAIRAGAARIVANAAVAGEFVPPAVKEQLRTLVGDADPDVRRRTALALAVINDADAILPLLTQLGQEPDSAVRAAIAQAVAPIRDPRSVEPLLRLLSDPRIDTAQAAATALSDPELGKKIRAADPALADRAAAELMAAVRDRTTPQDTGDLRAELIKAVGAMQSKEQGPALARLMGPNEVPKVRRAVLGAVGALRMPELAERVVESINDPDRGVRLAAIRALGQTANTFAQQSQLAERIDPNKEPDPEVQEAAWAVLSELFKLAPSNQLEPWEYRLKDAPARRLVVLRILRDRDRAAGETTGLAGREQQIGEAAIKAGFNDEAVTSLRNAMSIAVKKKDTVREQLVSEKLMQALLRSRKFGEAINFYQAQIAKDKGFQPPLSAEIRQEVERLFDLKDFDGAKQLIDSALAANPGLESTQINILRSIANKIENRSREQNLMPDAPKPLPLNARAE